MLVARDEQSCLVVSYKEIKQCIESAFRFVILCSFNTVAYVFDVSDLMSARRT